MAVDDHLSAFAATPGGKASIPGKDNGVDIEGLAVLAEDRVLVGLRGPVLRGWAMVLDLRIKASKEHTSGRIKMKGNPRALSKHFLDLGGLGIRELRADHDDLIILAGPTMVLDGPVRLFRWPGGAAADRSSVAPTEDLQLICELPHGHGDDHPEGFTLIGATGASDLLIAHDSPNTDRLRNDGKTLLMDVFPWP
jgi:hypothetical protein